MKRSKSEVQNRQKQLLELIKNRHSISIAEASEALDVSTITIRRDLEVMERQKLVTRFHGGAQLAAADIPSIPQLSVRDRMQLLQKHQIAQYAASLVGDRSTVFLNAGSTTYLIMKELCSRPIRLITNNVHAIELFNANENKADLIMTGGEYNAHNCSFLGDMSSQLLLHLHADLCILGVNGINSLEGVTSYSYQETLLNQTMIKQCSGKHIVVADGTKIGKLFCFTTSTLENIDMLITDSSADQEELAKISAQHVEVVLADQLKE